MADEVELKLRINAADVPRLKRHPAIKAALTEPSRTRRLVSIYYDTPQLALLDAGISLRVRRMSGHWFQAVKGSGKALAGLHQRSEWEGIIAAGRPDFSKITEPALTRIFDDQALRDALQPIFTTDTRRTEWHLLVEDGSQVEMALDLGEVQAGEQRETISEVELELKHGHAGHLFQFALALQADIPLWIENVSKAQRGYAYYRPQPPAIVKAALPALARDDSASGAFRHIAWECLSHLQGNQDMVLHGEDVEGVHQMRVALRRLRSALDVFRSVVSKQSGAAITEELRWITDVLGQARDLDVFVTQTLPPLLLQLQAHPGLSQLEAKAAAARQQAYDEVRAALASQRYQRLLLTLGAWLENQGWRDADSVECSVLEVAQTMLAKRHKQLKQHGRRLLHMHPEERHATRIAAKKLRYAAEFFTSLYPASQPQQFLGALAKLQDVLGVLNDIAVTEGLIHRLIGSRPNRALDEALYIFIGWNACNVMRRMEGLEGVWKRFAQQAPFWL